MKEITDLEKAALEVLKSTGSDVLEAALVARAGKRARTQSDFRYITRRFRKRCPGLTARRVRAITPQDCAGYIEAAFDTPRQRQKARLILSGVFSTARRRGWCSENPVAQVERPQVVEKPIAILEPEEITTLLRTAAEYEGGKCLPAVGMMLYAGIRPHEVARLRWEQVNLREHSICILPRHSKTGGARLVTIHPPLADFLQQHRQAPEQRICPAQCPCTGGGCAAKPTGRAAPTHGSRMCYATPLPATT